LFDFKLLIHRLDGKFLANSLLFESSVARGNSISSLKSLKRILLQHLEGQTEIFSFLTLLLLSIVLSSVGAISSPISSRMATLRFISRQTGSYSSLHEQRFDLSYNIKYGNTILMGASESVDYEILSSI
jgi:hypothetical protein